MELLMDMEMDMDMGLGLDLVDGSEQYDDHDLPKHDDPFLEGQEEHLHDDDDDRAHHPLLRRCENAMAIKASLDNDPSMRLTDEERAWALQLRESILAADEPLPFPLTDMEYVQFALVTRGDLKEATRRIHGMQAFRQEYGINETMEQVEVYFHEWFRHQPGFLLHMDTDPDTFEAIIVIDLSAFQPNVATGHRPSKTPADTRFIKPGIDFQWRVESVKNYYQYNVSCTNFSSIRQGVFMIIDCDGLTWENFTMDYTNRYHSELWSFYPIKYKSTLCYNTGIVANVGWSMVRPLMDRTMRETFQLGCQIVEMEGTPTPERLNELYLQPTPELAQANLLKRIKDLLMLRKLNMERFRL